MHVLLFAVLHAGDQDLSLRLQQRDPRALAELYDRYGRMAYALIVRIVRDGGIAEDLVQETFLRVWNRVDGFDAGRGALGPWLLSVARNRAIDYLRSREGRMRNALELNETEHPSLFADLRSEMLERDAIERIRRAMTTLDSRHREAIELAYFEGLSQSEIAARMGQPLGTIKTWVRRGLEHLRGAVVAAA